ncbi:MAG: type II toxin-antitoxin system RelE/ParE family toxin [Anaerolineae bacterium]|nr:type II toxin-antitoxin system RelE/ParE family toxin [Anaerolineae bacterium]
MNDPSIEIEYSDRFKKDVKRLVKKYRHLRADISTFVEQLMRGELPGDQIQGVGYPVYKVRIRSSDLTKGKSGGFRVIYYLKTEKRLILLTTYAKSEREDISQQMVKQIIEEYES